MDYKKSYALMWVLLLVGVVLLGVVHMLKLDAKWMAVGFLAIVVGLFQLIFFFRCPRCGMSWIGWDRITIPVIPRYCPHCGESIGRF